MSSTQNFTSTSPRSSSPLRFSSVPSPSPAKAKPSYINTSFNTSDMCYPSSPAPSTASTSSAASFQVGASGLNLTDLYSPALGKFMCPMQGCLYGVLGFPTTEELDQHITVLGHYPEPSGSLDPRVTILNFDNSLDSTDSWLSSQQEVDDLQNVHYNDMSISSPVTAISPFEFTFTYEQSAPKKFPATPKTPTSPTGSACDCQHCQLPPSPPPVSKSFSNKPGSNKRKRSGSSIYDIPTPLTVQLPPPLTIIGYPSPPPPPPSRSATVNKAASSSASTSSSTLNPNDYAVWQQKIQIAQVTEMIQAQQKQRDAQRRKLEIQIPPATAPCAPLSNQNIGGISGEVDYSGVYGFPRPPYTNYYSVHPVC